jgi:hypothetical protein
MDSWAFSQSLCRDLDTLRNGNEDIWTIEMDVLTYGEQLGLYMLQLEQEQDFRTSHKR